MTHWTAFKSRSYTEHLLRVGVAFAFLYPPIHALAEPTMWIGYIPAWVPTLTTIPAVTMLHLFGLIEIVLGVWLLIGRTVRIPALVAGALLLFITVANPNQFVILFRDVSLALAAFALAAYPARAASDRPEA